MTQHGADTQPPRGQTSRPSGRLKQGLRPRRPPATPAPRPDWWQRGAAIGGLVSVLLVAVGLYLTNSFNRDQLSLQRKTTQEQQDLALKGQRADRFVAAVDQLGQEGADKLGVRLGGIYALETLMKDSPEDEDTVIEVLCAFVRTHTPFVARFPPETPDSPADIRAAITVLGRRHDPEKHARLDLTRALLGLRRANLSAADLSGADLTYADLSGADLSGADLSSAILNGADLTNANLSGANLSGTQGFATDLSSAKLLRANLTGADMKEAHLTEAEMNGAELKNANLSHANLNLADLTGAHLHAADLTYADLDGTVLIGADLKATGVVTVQVACSHVDASTTLPPGVLRPAEDAPDSPDCIRKWAGPQYTPHIGRRPG
ncbi:pentapeptide repeat-containing protein [Actinoplanes sp. CA-142083]|uniref:pentapeptide repeat-containing protein n=1 Tax=Actinoplanes sp. CA-142083 TaxID=3239903 RepID=UPI003D928021